MDYRFGWYALAVSVILELPIDRAFERLDGIRKHNITKEEVEDMIKLKPDHTYQELSEVFGINPTLICTFVTGYKKVVF